MPQKLGQHFLINRSAIQKIIAALDLEKNDTIIEIGPGEGALTFPLLEKCEKLNCKLIAIEKDQQLVNWLLGKLVTWTNWEVTKGDALKIINQVTSQLSNWKLVGNIPYYITGKLMRVLSELENKPSLIVLTIQKEVAERIVSKPPKMNLLASAIQIWAKPEIIGRLSSKDFDPPPEVDSAILKLVPEPKNPDFKRYFTLVKAIFKQPRKTVLNNLSTPQQTASKSKEEILNILRQVGLTGQERPQNLTLETLIKLSTLF